jgi:hypothetical protein
MSIRLRLTLLYSGLVLGVVLVVTVSRVTFSTIESALAEEARSIVYSRPFRPDFDHERYDTRRVAAPETYVQARSPEGAILSRTSNLGDFDLPIDNSRLSTAQNGEAWTDVVSTDNGRLFILNQPIVSRGQFAGVVQFARSLAEQDESLETTKVFSIASEYLLARTVTFNFTGPGLATCTYQSCLASPLAGISRGPGSPLTGWPFSNNCPTMPTE